jgi:diacylglycerol kinase (ATP)
MKSFCQGFIYAFHGIAHVVRTQRNARVHLVFMGAVVAAGLYFRVSTIEWAILALTMSLVLSAEILNTAVELQVDLATSTFDPRAKAAKDAGAGAVLVTALGAIAVGLAIFGPRLWALVVTGTYTLCK